MKTRVSLLIKTVCAGAIVFGISAPSSACWFPFCWHGYPTYQPAYPAYYGPVYGSSCGSSCSPCGAGGCGVRTFYGPLSGCSACGCAPCACSPCGIGCSPCGDGCGVDAGYAPNADPVPDAGADAGGQGRQTFAEEESTGGVTEDPPMPAPGDDDFVPADRGDTDGTDGTDPFPDFERPVLPMESGDGEDAGPQPLENLEDERVTLRVTPTRQRVRAEARYRVPRMVRLEVVPESPWQPHHEAPAQVASK